MLGQRLSKIVFDEIYVSDLNRTIQTANKILPYHKSTSIIYEKRIREKSGGILEGKSMAYVRSLAEVKYADLEKRNTFEEV
jgi:broad specificity phosphatase PhoE